MKYFFSFAFIVSVALFGGGEDKKQIKKISINDRYNYINTNNCLMYVSNNGDGSHDPITGGNGFYWPVTNTQVPQQNKGLIFEDGLVWGGKVNGMIRVNGNTHRQGLQAGKILSSGIADDPLLEKYRVYKIRKDWKNYPPGSNKEQLEKDWNEWPVEDGAPWIDIDGDGKFTRGIDEPECIGDETLWYVMNDQDKIRSFFTYGSPPIGLEIQCAVFGFSNYYSPLHDMVFKKYKIINKSGADITDMYLSYWSDDDMGSANDDYVGCDTLLNMGYTFNGDNYDEIYGTPPPAVSHVFLQGPIVNSTSTDSGFFEGKWIKGKRNLPLTSFVMYLGGSAIYRDPRQGEYQGTIEMYYYLQGLIWNGDPYIDPNTNQPTKFVLSGDPYYGTGWYEGEGWIGGPYYAGDHRYLMSSGPFTFAKGDTQEVVVGIVAALGVDRLHSVKKLKTNVAAAHRIYKSKFQLNPNIPKPELKYYAGEEMIRLYWDNSLLNYSEFDPLIPDTIQFTANGNNYTAVPTERNFKFEGFRLWQYADAQGNSPILLDEVDLPNGVSAIYKIQDWLIDSVGNSNNIIMSLNDAGLKQYSIATKDAFTGEDFIPEQTYYFGLTMLAYSRFSYNPIAESKPHIIEVKTGRKPIDIKYSYQSGDLIDANLSVGGADAKAWANIFDPDKLTDDDYKITYKIINNKLYYNIINISRGDTFQTLPLTVTTGGIYGHLYPDSLARLIYDGFFITHFNEGNDSLTFKNKQSIIRSINEINGGGGVVISPPKNVLNEFNSSGKWKLVPGFAKSTNPYYSVNQYEAAGEYDYEIRFTAQGSQFYYSRTSGINPHLKRDSLSNSRLPFEVWRKNQWGIEERMFIKIADSNFTSTWNYDSTDGKWESIYIFKKPGETYLEPLPAQSSVLANAEIQLFFTFAGEKPVEGTKIKVTTWKKLTEGNEFIFKMISPKVDYNFAKENLDKISVFPNPYFGRESFEDTREFVTFTNLPQKVVVRIYSLAGTFIQKLEKENSEQYLRWDLKNRDGYFVGSGVYLAYLEMPGIGTKVMKVAVIQENRFYLGN